MEQNSYLRNIIALFLGPILGILFVLYIIDYEEIYPLLWGIPGAFAICGFVEGLLVDKKHYKKAIGITAFLTVLAVTIYGGFIDLGILAVGIALLLGLISLIPMLLGGLIGQSIGNIIFEKSLTKQQEFPTIVTYEPTIVAQRSPEKIFVDQASKTREFNLMKCPHCQYELDYNSRFCKNCGMTIKNN